MSGARAMFTAGLIAAAAGWLLTLAEPERILGADSPCIITATRTIAPLSPMLGAEVTVTTGLQTQCVGARPPLHVILLIDASEGMTAGRLNEVRGGLELALRTLDSHWREEMRLGVVSFSDVGRRHTGLLTTDISTLVAALNNIVIGGEPRLDEGIREAFAALRAARPSVDSPLPRPREVVLFISGGTLTGCETAKQAATNLLRNEGVVLATVCRGNRCQVSCLPDDLARYVYKLPDWTAFDGPLYDLVEDRGPFMPIRRVHMLDTLSPELLYLRGGDPTGGAGNALGWSFDRWPTQGITLSYVAEVRTCGLFSSSIPGQVYVDVEYLRPLWNLSDERYFLDNPMLDVPCAVPSPTATAQGSVVRPTGTATRTVPPTHTPATPGIPLFTPTPTAAPHWPTAGRVWLPIVLPGACASERGPLDVVLVFDVSSSMATADVPGFANRWEAVHALVLATIYGGENATGLREGIDRVGLVAFGGGDGEPVVALPLEPCCDPVRRDQVERFWRLDGSDMAAALRSARVLYAGTPPRSADRVLLLVTDGDFNQTDPTALESALQYLRNANVEIHAVGVGNEVDAGMLLRLAGHPARVHMATYYPSSEMTRGLATIVRCLR